MTGKHYSLYNFISDAKYIRIFSQISKKLSLVAYEIRSTKFFCNLHDNVQNKKRVYCSSRDLFSLRNFSQTEQRLTRQSRRQIWWYYRYHV